MMVEFCYECYKKYFDKNAKKENLVIGDYLDLCEGCAEYKQTVIKEKRSSILDIFKIWTK